MGFKFHHILAFVFVATLVACNALESEDYWKSVLPNTPMPKAIKDLLQPTREWADEKSTDVGVGQGGVGVDTGNPGGGTNVGVGEGGVGVDTGKPNGGTVVGVGKGGVNVGTHTRSGRPVYVGVSPSSNPFNYLYAATATQLHDNPNVALFFLEHDLHPSKKMTLHFQKSTNKAPFLPRGVANTIPFSSNKMSVVLKKFSINPTSLDADVIRKTINECEEKGIKGEEKLCATSLESMVDFSTSKLGKDVAAISTDATDDGKMKEYNIMGVKRVSTNGKAIVACHKMHYPYGVFYCHKTGSTAAYKVSMVAPGDGSRVDAVAVCHRDTAAWNPKHLAFQVLKVKQGTIPICHFLPEDHVVWIPKY